MRACLLSYRLLTVQTVRPVPQWYPNRLPRTFHTHQILTMPVRVKAPAVAELDGVDDTENVIEDSQRRLVLCFDGTGNAFQGNPADTNIVKLLEMFDHASDNQKHYYQPGIGTYTADGSVNRNFIKRTGAYISQTIDSGLATTFDQHVMAGYRFLMRYYTQGDLIYVFGFSRGAFTARYLSKMVVDLGLLSPGNEEMVPFAYKVFQDAYMEGGPEDVGGSSDKSGASQANGGEQNVSESTPLLISSHGTSSKPTETAEEGPAKQMLKTFRKTFCTHSYRKFADRERKQGSPEAEAIPGVQVHFLGLFDTVSSVGTFDKSNTSKKGLPSISGTAKHVRHAVAIDERRVKFKADLLLATKKAEDVTKPQELHYNQDGKAIKEVLPKIDTIKEVFFPGNHGDIGGGWDPENEIPSRQEAEVWGNMNVFQKAWEQVRTLLTGKKRLLFRNKKAKQAKVNKEGDWFQLSDLALKWMIDELTNLPNGPIYWDIDRKANFLRRYHAHRANAIWAKMHDTMSFGRGSSFGMTLMWKLMGKSFLHCLQVCRAFRVNRRLCFRNLLISAILSLSLTVAAPITQNICRSSSVGSTRGPAWKNGERITTTEANGSTGDGHSTKVTPETSPTTRTSTPRSSSACSTFPSTWTGTFRRSRSFQPGNRTTTFTSGNTNTTCGKPAML